MLPIIIGEPVDEKLYEEQALAFHLMLRGLEHVAADTTIFLSERRSDLLDDLGAAANTVVDLHSLSMGNYFIDIELDEGQDTAVGDNGLDISGEIIGTYALGIDLRASIEQALLDQQATIIDPYTFNEHPQPAPANPSVTGTFGTDTSIADANDHIVDNSSVIVLPGVLDAATPE